MNGQLNLFNEVEDIADHSQEEVIEEEVDVKKKRKKTKETDYSRLPVIIKEHKLEDDKCEICGNKLKQLAPQIIDELMYEPARFYIVRRRRRTKPTDQRKYRNTIGSGRNRIQQICEWNTTIPTGTGTETKAIDDQSCNDVKLADEEFETARGDIR